MESVSRFFTPPTGSFFLLGPRGTGKSWWTRHTFPDALFVDLLEPAMGRRLLARPETLESLAEGMARPGTIVIDEVQKVPELLDVVHHLIERKKGWRFVLTGSSARKLRRGGVNLLGGRAAQARFFPYLAGELKHGFSLSKALKLGLVPSVLGAPNPEETLTAYCDLYIREEIQAERLVRNVAAFARFLETASFSHAAQLNVANVARECGVERKTVVGFVEVLEDLLLATRLEPFTRRAKRDIVSHPKFYFFDAGVFRSLRPAGPLDQPEEIEGAALEGLVFQHLQTWSSWGKSISNTGGGIENRELKFWRTRTGREVDFIINTPHELVAIEVKNTGKVRDADLNGLLAFMEDYPKATAVLLYRGKERLRERGVLCLPVEPFLQHLHPNKPVLSAINP
jgi:predicted AAA+ superfamily ATPase